MEAWKTPPAVIDMLQQGMKAVKLGNTAAPALWTAASLGTKEEVLKLIEGEGMDIIEERGGPSKSSPLFQACRRLFGEASPAFFRREDAHACSSRVEHSPQHCPCVNLC